MADQSQMVFDQTQNTIMNANLNDSFCSPESQPQQTISKHEQDSFVNEASNSTQYNGSNDQSQGQKRQADQNQNYQQKRMRTDNYNNSTNQNKYSGNSSFPNRVGKVDLRILLPSKDAGAIIGRGGANIKKLRADHKTIIQVPDCDGPERLLLIGGDTEAAIGTILDIIPLIEENSKYGPDHAYEFRLLVHQSQAGCIIGRGGDKIKELRMRYNLDMKVFSECAPMSTERICQMRGKAQDIVNCLRETLQLLESAPPKGTSRPYDPHNYSEFLSSQYGGYVSDKRGLNRNQNQTNGAGFNQQNNNRNNQSGNQANGTSQNRGGNFYQQNNDQRGANQRNTHQNQNRSNQGNRKQTSGVGKGNPGLNENRRSNSINNNNNNQVGNNRNNSNQNRNNSGNRPSNNNNMNNNNNNNNFNRSQNQSGSNVPSAYNENNQNYSNNLNNQNKNQNIMTNQVTIPNELAGAIIGPKGQKIQQIREQSGAGITIDKPVPGNNDRIITITGTSEQIQNAQYLLQMTVKQSGLWHGN